MARIPQRRPRPTRRRLRQKEIRDYRPSPARHRRVLRILQPQDGQAEGRDRPPGRRLHQEPRGYHRRGHELGEDRQAGGSEWQGPGRRGRGQHQETHEGDSAGVEE